MATKVESEICIADAISYEVENKVQRDDHDMRRMGKKQQFRRNFQVFAISSFSMISMMGWVYIPINGTQIISVAGTGGLIVMFITNFFGFLITVISLAEMASIAPTAGGQYHWTSEFAPPSAQKPLSYLSGWLSSLSWLVGIGSGIFLCAQLIPAVVVLQHPEYYPQPWHSYLILVGLVGVAFCINAYLTRYLPLLTGLVMCLVVVGFLSIFTSMMVLSPKVSTHQVFHTFGPDTPQNLLNIIPTQAFILYSSLGFDSPCHLAEETHHAARVIPKSMIYAYCMNGLFDFAMVLTISYCWVYPDVYAKSSYPFLELYRTATGSYIGSIAFTSITIVLVTFSATNFMASTSRQLFAFARDDGLPFSSWISRVDRKSRTPINALIATAIFPILISLIGLGSTVAFNATVSLLGMAIAATYQVSLLCLVWRRIWGKPLPEAPWSLGRWGLPLNIWSILYNFYALVYVAMPGVYPVTAENLNWAPVIFGAALLLSLIHYLVWARKVYEGPVVKVIHED